MGKSPVSQLCNTFRSWRHNATDATDAVDAVDADEDEVFRTIARVRGDDPRVSTGSTNDVEVDEDDEDVARNGVGDLDGHPWRNVRAADDGRRGERGGHVQVGGV